MAGLVPQGPHQAAWGQGFESHRTSRKLAGAQGEGDHMLKLMADTKSEVAE